MKKPKRINLNISRYILFHNVTFYGKDVPANTEPDVEFVQSQIIDGMSLGQYDVDGESYVWWAIEFER